MWQSCRFSIDRQVYRSGEANPNAIGLAPEGTESDMLIGQQ
jgi:hypothetical protein